jgi:hypothetical protein
MATTRFKDRSTPGVYVTEFAAFPPTIVGVATAVPIFIGYTQTAVDPASSKQLYMQAIPISSMADYYSYFGYGYAALGIVEPQPMSTDSPPRPIGTYDFQAPSSDGTNPPTTNSYVVGTSTNLAGDITPTEQFNLFSAMQLFYANGGGNCFVISVGNYWGTDAVKPTLNNPPTPVDKGALLAGLEVAQDTRGPTMLVVPDACLLVTAPVAEGDPYTYPDYATVAVAMLRQAATLQDRVAILDMPGALVPATWTVPGMAVARQAFYDAIAAASPYFSYGVAYGPAVETSLLGAADITYLNLMGNTGSTTLMNNLLTTQALALYQPRATDAGAPAYSQTFQDVAAHIAMAFPVADPAPITSTPPDVTGTSGGLQVSMTPAAASPPDSPPNPVTPPNPSDTAAVKALDQYLVNAVPLLGNIQQMLASKLNVLPPSGIMAGIWAQNDANRGVWNAPANLSLNEVIAPMVALSDDDQADYNAPLNGNAIDILRPMVNRGTVVWGARTLDANSLDYRYIQVRRTLIYIEQSIKLALQQFVFAANDGGTWATVTATISNFLTQLWQAGGLMGDKASEAFTVKCGVPTTMSGLDVLNGYMVVNVTVQMIHPAEFIELTFTQTMQGV